MTNSNVISYMNIVLIQTEPSKPQTMGLFSKSRRMKKFKRELKRVAKQTLEISCKVAAVAAVGLLTGGVGVALGAGAVLTGVVTGAAVGAASGTIQATDNDQNIGKAAFRGALGGAISGGMSSVAAGAPFVTKLIFNASGSGISAGINEQDISKAALRSLISDGVGASIQHNPTHSDIVNSTAPSVVAAAVVGEPVADAFIASTTSHYIRDLSNQKSNKSDEKDEKNAEEEKHASPQKSPKDSKNTKQEFSKKIPTEERKYSVDASGWYREQTEKYKLSEVSVEFEHLNPEISLPIGDLNIFMDKHGVLGVGSENGFVEKTTHVEPSKHILLMVEVVHTQYAGPKNEFEHHSIEKMTIVSEKVFDKVTIQGPGIYKSLEIGTLNAIGINGSATPMVFVRSTLAKAADIPTAPALVESSSINADIVNKVVSTIGVVGAVGAIAAGTTALGAAAAVGAAGVLFAQ